MVSESEPVCIIVEISRAEPFRGTVAERGGATQPFNGWTAFAAAVAAVVRRIASPHEDQDAGEVAGA